MDLFLRAPRTDAILFTVQCHGLSHGKMCFPSTNAYMEYKMTTPMIDAKDFLLEREQRSRQRILLSLNCLGYKNLMAKIVANYNNRKNDKINQLECLEKCLWIRKGQVCKAGFVYLPLLSIYVNKAELAMPWICRKRLGANKIDVKAHSVYRKQLCRNLPESGFSACANVDFSTKILW